MAYDALSSSTRKIRSRLLNISAAFIIINIFKIRMSGQGIIEVPNDVITPVLNLVFIGSMIYLFITFLVYAYDDWRNEKKRDIELRENRIIKSLNSEIIQTFYNRINDELKLKLYLGAARHFVMAITKKDIEDKQLPEIAIQYLNAIEIEDISQAQRLIDEYHSQMEREVNLKWKMDTDRIAFNFRLFWEFFFPPIAFLVSAFSPLYSQYISTIFMS